MKIMRVEIELDDGSTIELFEPDGAPLFRPSLVPDSSFVRATLSIPYGRLGQRPPEGWEVERGFEGERGKLLVQELLDFVGRRWMR